MWTTDYNLWQIWKCGWNCCNVLTLSVLLWLSHQQMRGVDFTVVLYLTSSSVSWRHDERIRAELWTNWDYTFKRQQCTWFLYIILKNHSTPSHRCMLRYRNSSNREYNALPSKQLSSIKTLRPQINTTWGSTTPKLQVPAVKKKTDRWSASPKQVERMSTWWSPQLCVHYPEAGSMRPAWTRLWLAGLPLLYPQSGTRLHPPHWPSSSRKDFAMGGLCMPQHSLQLKPTTNLERTWVVSTHRSSMNNYKPTKSACAQSQNNPLWTVVSDPTTRVLT